MADSTASRVDNRAGRQHSFGRISFPTIVFVLGEWAIGISISKLASISTVLPEPGKVR